MKISVTSGETDTLSPVGLSDKLPKNDLLLSTMLSLTIWMVTGIRVPIVWPDVKERI